MANRKIITYGTFDLFHVGHVRLLERARSLGDELIVGLSTDEFNAQKGKRSTVCFKDRKAVLEACRYVDAVIPETHWEQKAVDVGTHGISVFVMGDDWKGRFDFLSAFCEVIYLPRTPDISTTDLRTSILQRAAVA